MTGEVKPQDAVSGLVARERLRTTKRCGTLTERTLVGEGMSATILTSDRDFKSLPDLPSRTG